MSKDLSVQEIKKIKSMLRNYNRNEGIQTPQQLSKKKKSEVFVKNVKSQVGVIKQNTKGEKNKLKNNASNNRKLKNYRKAVSIKLRNNEESGEGRTSWRQLMDDEEREIIEQIKKDEEKELSTMTQAVTGDGNKNVSLVFTPVPQAQTIPIPCEIDDTSFSALSAVYSFYAMAQGIAIDEFATIGSQTVGVHYAVAATIALDLWRAMSGEISVFNNAPMAYWEIRNAIKPTVIPGYSFYFDVQTENLYGAGGLLPLGFPIQVDRASLSWIINHLTPLATLETTVPILSDSDVLNDGPNYVTDLWSRIYSTTDKAAHRLISEPEKCWTARSVAAFSGNLPVTTPISSFDRYSQFRLEVPIASREKWLAKLGLVRDDQTKNFRRYGYGSFMDFVTSANFADRVMRGVVGRAPCVVIRPKYIELEKVLHYIIASTISADIQYNGKAGTNSINQENFDRSVLYNTDAADFLYGAMQGIVRKFQVTNAVCLNFPSSQFNACAGAQWITGAVDNVDLGLTYINEALASLTPIVEELREGKWLVVEYPVLAFTGIFTPNFTTTALDLPAINNLKAYVQIMFPGVSVASYHYNNNATTSLPAQVSLSINNCYTRGQGIPRAIQVFSQVLSSLQGNIYIGQVVSGTHTDKTLMHYTELASSTPQQTDPPTLSLFYRSKLDSLANKYKFTQQDISYDMTRILPSFYGPLKDYGPLWHAMYSQDYDTDQMVSRVDYGIMVGKENAHPIAGVGNEVSIGDIAQVTQMLGGGFGGLGDLLGGLGSIAMNLLGGVLPILDPYKRVGKTRDQVIKIMSRGTN